MHLTKTENQSEIKKIDELFKSVSKNNSLPKDKVKEYSKEIIKSSEKINYELGIVKGLKLQAEVSLSEGDELHSISLLERLVEIARQNKDENLLFFGLNTMSLCYRNLGNYTKSLQTLLELFRIQSENQNHKNNFTIYNNIGILYYELDAFGEALEFFEKGLKQKNIEQSLQEKSNLCNNIGVIYLKLGKLDLAFKNLNQALEIRMNLKDSINIGHSYLNIFMVLFELKKYKRANENILKAIKVFKELNELRELGISYINLALIEAKFKKYKQAETNITKGLDLLKDDKSHLKTQAFLMTSQVYQNLGKYEEALEFEIKYETLKTNNINILKLNEINKIQQRFDLEQQRKENELLKQKKIKLIEANEAIKSMISEKEELVKIVAHDLRNPLQYILMRCENLFYFNHLFTKDKICGYVETFSKSLSKMLEIHKMFQNLNSLESNKIELNLVEFEPKRILKECISNFEVLANSKNIKIKFSYTERTLLVKNDSSYFLRVIQNLISNAIKFSPKGKNIFVELLEFDDFFQVQIKDNGQGMTPEDLKNVFKKFTKLSAKPTGNEQSTGLGLSISKQLVELMGGKIWVQSAGKGKGCTFFVEIPKRLEELRC